MKKKRTIKKRSINRKNSHASATMMTEPGNITNELQID